MLELRQVSAGYGAAWALRRVSLTVAAGQIVALVGANGAGKSTLAKVVSGLAAPREGEVFFEGQLINTLDPRRRVQAGIAHVPEGREVFAGLSVRDNLVLGAFTVAGNRSDVATRIREACALFPPLLERLDSPAGDLSGGQQQMLAIARGLMSRPRLLVLDEPSLGLAPVLVTEIFEILAKLRQGGMAILLSEQNARMSLALADQGYVLEAGQVAASGPASDLLNDAQLVHRYLGGAGEADAGTTSRRQAMSAQIAPMFKAAAAAPR